MENETNVRGEQNRDEKKNHSKNYHKHKKILLPPTESRLAHFIPHPAAVRHALTIYTLLFPYS